MKRRREADQTCTVTSSSHRKHVLVFWLQESSCPHVLVLWVSRVILYAVDGTGWLASLWSLTASGVDVWESKSPPLSPSLSLALS